VSQIVKDLQNWSLWFNYS